MTIRDAIKLIDRELYDDRGYNFGDLEELIDEVGLGFCDWCEVKEIRVYPVIHWLCTDTHVGMEALFMGDELIAVTTQEGRKCDKYYYWVSMSAQQKVRSLIIEKYLPQEMNESIFSVEDTVESLFDRGNLYGCLTALVNDQLIKDYHNE